LKSGQLQLAVVLGLVTAVGPFAIDAYLPALPAIGQALAASPSAVQMTLTAFFLTLGFGQLAYGPAADMLARKAPLYFGLALFVLSSVGCALSQSVATLIVFRLLQGLGACAGMVVPRAIVRDIYTGADAARLMSMLMLLVSISPILAPLTGGLIVAGFGWRGVFWFVFAAALLGLLLLHFALQETRAHHERASSTVSGAFASYGQLFKDRHFIGLTMTGSFGVASFFSYLSNSSFVFINHYHYSPQIFGVFFGLNAFAFFAAAQGAAWLIGRFGMARVIRFAAAGYCLAMVMVAALFLVGVDSVVVLVSFLFTGFGCLGLVIPTTSVMALEEQGHVAGTASALLGTLQFATGAVIMSLIAPSESGTPIPMLITIAAVSVLTLVLALITLHGTASPPDKAIGREAS
jgi:DHA1 family bicyclomycin/chloramphenicol resistance-like MFS transporter